MRIRWTHSEAWQNRGVLVVVLIGAGLSAALLALTLRGPSQSPEQEDWVTFPSELPSPFDDLSGGAVPSPVGPAKDALNQSQPCGAGLRARCESLISDGAVASTDVTTPNLAPNTVDQSPSFANATPFPGANDDRNDSASSLAGSMSPSSAGGGTSARGGPSSAGGGSVGGGGAGSGGSSGSRTAGSDQGTTLGAQPPSGRLSLSGEGADVGEALPTGGSDFAQRQETDTNWSNLSQGLGSNDSGGGTVAGDTAPGSDNLFPIETPGFQKPTFIEELALGGSAESGVEQGGPSGFAPEQAAFQGQEAADVVATPEPASLVLFGSGLALAAWRIRRQQSKAHRIVLSRNSPE